MSRAALLPTPGDPFLLKYWLENYAKYWKGEVDKLYVHLNTPIEREVVEYEQELLDRYGVNFIYKDHQIEHGDAINELLDMCSEELVMLIEDDAFIFRRGVIDECFYLLEKGECDVLGSKRGSCSMEILEAAKNKWGLNYDGYGDQGCNFWPCFFFIKRELLEKTDRKFGSRAWKMGETIEPLGHVVNGEIVCGDTFVNTSLQLRAMGLRFLCFPQYHGSPDDLEHFEKRTNLWDGNAPWTHVGSLSSGVGGVLVDDNGISLATRTSPQTQRDFVLPPAHVNEWARRIQWWQAFYDNSDPNKITEFREEYRKALERLYIACGVHKKDTMRRQMAYNELFK
jgi:hypothetical protein